MTSVPIRLRSISIYSCHKSATAICALLHAKNHSIDRQSDRRFNIHDFNPSERAVRTSRLTRDGRSANKVGHDCCSVRNLIGISRSPFLREFCNIQNPVHATNLPQRIFATRRRQECGSHFAEHINRRQTLQDIGDPPHGRPVKVDQDPE